MKETKRIHLDEEKKFTIARKFCCFVFKRKHETSTNTANRQKITITRFYNYAFLVSLTFNYLYSVNLLQISTYLHLVWYCLLDWYDRASSSVTCTYIWIRNGAWVIFLVKVKKSKFMRFLSKLFLFLSCFNLGFDNPKPLFHSRFTGMYENFVTLRITLLEKWKFQICYYFTLYNKCTNPNLHEAVSNLKR